MHSISRRTFLGASLAGLAAQTVLGADKPAKTLGSVTPQNTLFLTWQRDPTTTMTVQWVGPAAKPRTRPLLFLRSKRRAGKTRPPPSNRIP